MGSVVCEVFSDTHKEGREEDVTSRNGESQSEIFHIPFWCGMHRCYKKSCIDLMNSALGV